jgi:hypothetical protein
VNVLGFDLETYPIGPKRAPRIVAGALNISADAARVSQVSDWAVHMRSYGDREIYFFWAAEISQFLELCEAFDGTVVAHNGAYDLCCIGAHDPANVGRIFKLFHQRKIQCTYIRSLVWLNAQGQLKSSSGRKFELEHGKHGYTSYVGACHMFCGLDLSAAKDKEVQITYHRMQGIPFEEWPEKYREYLIQDVRYLPDLFLAQEQRSEVYLKYEYETVYIFKEAPRRAAIHFSLSLASAWGMRVDIERVRALREEAEYQVSAAAEEMLSAGLAVPLKGVARERAVARGKLAVRVDNKAVAQLIKDGYERQGLDVPMTAKNQVQTSRSAMLECGHPVLRAWAEVGDRKTVWSTFLPALEKSFENRGVINTNYFPYLETGRVSAFKPNLLNPPRSGGIRECIIARPGSCFVFCDYEANELRVLSQVLLDHIGRSRLAELYQEDPGFDPHTYMATRKLRITYEEGKKRKAAGDKELKSMRQLMKCCNFGFPGGMASRTFIEFAKGYGVKVTQTEADDLKQFFFSQFPEIKAYLGRIGTRVNNYEGQGYIHRAQRFSANRRFCQLANLYFQGLAAEGGLVAFARVSEAAYTQEDSPLYGTRPVLFVHDEIILETPLHLAHDAAMELKRVMEQSMSIFTPDIPSLAEPALATRWWKGAEPVYNDEGRLIPADWE